MGERRTNIPRLPKNMITDTTVFHVTNVRVTPAEEITPENSGDPKIRRHFTRNIEIETTKGRVRIGIFADDNAAQIAITEFEKAYHHSNEEMPSVR